MSHLGEPVQDQARILEVIEQAQEQDLIESLSGSEAVGMHVFIHDLQLDAELPRGELRLADEFHVGLHQHAAFSAAQHHLDGKIAGIAADIQHRLPQETGGNIRLEEFPARLRAIGGLLSGAGAYSARQLEILVPPSEGANLICDFRGVVLRSARKHGEIIADNAGVA